MFESLGNIYGGINPQYSGPDAVNSASDVAAIAINVIMGLGFSFGVVAITYAMILYILSGGDPKQTKRAWDAFLYGVIGIAVAMAIVLSRNLVLTGFGISDPMFVNEIPDL